MKKFISYILILAMVFVILPFTTSVIADTDGYYTYTIYKGSATIKKCNASFDGDVTIPSKLGGYPVTGIGVSAFSGCSSITSIIIPESVTSIGNYAFSNCTLLARIEIPESVTSIGRHAFENCESLLYIEIPNKVNCVDEGTFKNCLSLKSVTMYDSITNINNGAFEGCESLIGIEIPENVTNIGNSAFSGCKSLTTVKMYNSVSNIGVSVFQGCSSLIKIEMSDNITCINWYAFKGCSSLTSITLSKQTTTIAMDAFQDCSSLVCVTMYDNVRAIGISAFDNCKSLSIINYGGTCAQWKSIDISMGNKYLTETTVFCELSYMDVGHITLDKDDVLEKQIIADFCYQDDIKSGKTIKDILEANQKNFNNELFGNNSFTKRNAYSQIGDWQVLHILNQNKTNGLVAMLLKHPSKNEYVIAYRGTEDFEKLGKDTIEDIKFAVFNKLGTQFNDALEYYKTIKDSINANARISLVGHSLGGALVTYVSAITGAKGYSFDGAAGHVIDLTYLTGAGIIDYTDMRNMTFANYTDAPVNSPSIGNVDISELIQRTNSRFMYEFDFETNEYISNKLDLLGKHDIYSTTNLFNNKLQLTVLNNQNAPTTKWRMVTDFDTLGILQTVDNKAINLIEYAIYGISAYYDKSLEISLLTAKVKGRLLRQGTTILGSINNDALSPSSYGYSAIDELISSYAKNTIYGGNGNDIITGAINSDTISSGLGENRVSGGYGCDQYIISRTNSNDSNDTTYINDFDENSIILKNPENSNIGDLDIRKDNNDNDNYNDYTVYDNDKPCYKFSIHKDSRAYNYHLYANGQELGTINSDGFQPINQTTQNNSNNNQDDTKYTDTIIEGLSEIKVLDEHDNILGTYSNKDNSDIIFGTDYQVNTISSTDDNNPYIEVIAKDNIKIEVSNNETTKIGIAELDNQEDIIKKSTSESINTTTSSCTIDLSNQNIEYKDNNLNLDTIYYDDQVSIDSEENITVAAGDTITLSANDDKEYSIKWCLDDNSKAKLIDNEDGTCSITPVFDGELKAIAYSEETSSFDSITINVEPLNISMEKGAEIRLGDVTGLRYLTSVDEQKINNLRDIGATINMGTLISPTDLLKGKELTLETPENKRAIVNYTSNSFYKKNNFTGFVGSIANINPWNINRNFLGRGFITIEYMGTSKTIYANYLDESADNNTRSICYVAQRLREDDHMYNSLTSNYKEIVDGFADNYIP